MGGAAQEEGDRQDRELRRAKSLADRDAAAVVRRLRTRLGVGSGAPDGARTSRAAGTSRTQATTPMIIMAVRQS